MADEFPFERYAARRLYYAFDFLPGSEDILYSSSTSGQFNLWRQAPPKNLTVGPARQLTGFDEWSVRFISPHPSGLNVLVFADKDGDENYQIFSVDPNKGWQFPLVNKPNVRNTFGIECISPDGVSAAYSSNERAPQDMDIVVTGIATGKTRQVLADGGAYTFGYWSADGRRATVVESLSSDDLSIYLVDIKTGKKINLTPHGDRAVFVPGPWGPDGEGFFVLSNENREFVGLGYLAARAGAKIKWLRTSEGDIEDVSLSPDGRTLALVANEGGYSVIHLQDCRTGKRLGSFRPGGVLSAGWGENSKLVKFSEDGKRLAFLFSKPTKPTEVYVMRVPRGEAKGFTEGFVGVIPERMMVKPASVTYPSLNRKIPAFLYKPKVARRRRSPVVLSIHGGPESQERPGYMYGGMYQYLLGRGIGVMAPNIRGSTGYGKAYQRLIHRDWGGGELKDIEHAAKFLRNIDWVDPDRIGLFGGSFGGFATLSAATRLPQYWRVAVEACGPSNLVTFAKSVPEFWKRFMTDLLGDPDKESDFLLDRSPVSYLENLRCPIMIVQEAKDPRVVKTESDQIVDKLKARGQEVEYIVFPDEGHGFTKRKNEFTAYMRMTEFLTKHLIGEN